MEYCKKILGLNVWYKQTGEGAPIVLLHGWGCDLNIFKSIQDNLEKNFKVYAIDLPGFGRSDAPKEVWGVKEYTSFIKEFFILESIKKPIIVGHSFGGRISILYSSQNPVDKVILVDSAGIKPKRKLKYYFKVFLYKAIKKIIIFLYKEKQAESILEKYRKKSGSSDYNNACGIMKQILVRIVNEDLSCVLPNIKAPTLLIWGKNDTATPISDAIKMKKLIPDAGLVVLEDAGHYSFIEKLNDFLIIINSFLKTK